MMTVKFGIIGLGRVGLSLVSGLRRNGSVVLAVLDHHEERMQKACSILKIPAGSPLNDSIWNDCDVIIISVQDKHICSVVNDLNRFASLRKFQKVVHTSGSIGLDVMTPLIEKGCIPGVFHPFRSFPDIQAGIESLDNTVFGISAHDPAMLSILNDLSRLFHGETILLTDESRIPYHLAAVFASNFPVILYQIAADLLIKTGNDPIVSWKAVVSIAQGIIDNLARLNSEDVISGPVIRRDIPTIEKHLEYLSRSDTEVSNLYRHLSLLIVDRFFPMRQEDSIRHDIERMLLDDAAGDQ